MTTSHVPPNQVRTPRPGSLRWRAAAPILLVAGLALAGCSGGGTSGSASTTVAPSSSASATATAAQVELSALLQDVGQYDGQRITTSGAASQVVPYVLALTPAAGTASTGGTPATPGPSESVSPLVSGTPSATASGSSAPSGSASGPAERLIVVHRSSTPPQGGSNVTVTGTVHTSLDVASIERTLGITLDPQVVQGLGAVQGSPVLVADTVSPMTGSTPSLTGATPSDTGMSPSMTGSPPASS